MIRIIFVFNINHVYHVCQSCHVYDVRYVCTVCHVLVCTANMSVKTVSPPGIHHLIHFLFFLESFFPTTAVFFISHGHLLLPHRPPRAPAEHVRQAGRAEARGRRGGHDDDDERDTQSFY